MLQLSLAGRAGRDAEYKQTQGGTDLCSFSIAADVGFGDNKQTIWVDVTKWGKGAKGLSGYIRKGDPVAVSGEMSTREHNGKTYIQCRADTVTLLGSKGDGRGERKRSADDDDGWQGQAPADLDDSIPF
jgi:single-strand DNA-binding protein